MQKILAGKKISIPTWQLTAVVTPVIAIDEKIFSADTGYAQFSHVMHPADNLQVDIVYDENTIDSLNFLNNQMQKTTLALPDTQEITDHTLKFIISGKNDNHSYLTETKNSVSWLLKVDLYIENLAVCALTLTIENGDFYIGENSTHVLEIQTPIYRWLFQHENNIIQYYSKYSS
jgi:hypothetical protein